MKVLSNILHKAGILKEADESYTSGGYTILVRNQGSGRIQSIASDFALPSQVGNGGKFLATDGVNALWVVNPSGTVSSVGLTVPTGFEVSNSPITSSGNIALAFATGYSLPSNSKQTDWDISYSKRVQTLTTTGTSGAATFSNNVLNIPQYQAQGNYITALTGEVTAAGPGSVAATVTNSAVVGKVITGVNITGGSISATDTILTAFGKLQNQINALVGGVMFQTLWNASTNTPTLTSSVGTKGHYYIVSADGSTNLDGITDWKLGDWAIYDGTAWRKVDNTDAVVSVNGFTGAVSLTTSNISEGTNLYYTDARARGAISLTTTGSSGSASYSSGVLNIPTYSLSGLGGVPTSRSLTINGTAYDLSADRTWTIPTVTSLAALTDVTITSIANNQLIRYNSTTSKWENWTPNYLTSFTEADTLATVTARGASTTTAISVNSASLDHFTLAGRFHFIGGNNFHITNNSYYNSAFKYQTAAAANKITLQSDGSFLYDYAAAGVVDANVTWSTVFSISNTGTATASSFVKSGGTASQYLMADGSTSTLTNPVTGTGTLNYIPKFTANGSTIGNSSLYYSESANANIYTFGSVGAGAIYNISQFNIYSNSTSEAFFQWGSNKYLYVGNSGGNVSISSINTGTHVYNNLMYYNGASANNRYLSLATEGLDRLLIKQTGEVLLSATQFHNAFQAGLLVGPLSASSNTVLEVRSSAGGQSSVYLTHGTSASLYNADVEIFNSGNFGIVVYNPGVVSSNYVLYYNAESTSNRYLAFQTEGSDRITINGNGTIQMNAYTTNGFVKFSGSDGTLVVDTNTYSLSSHTHSYFIGTTAVQASSTNQALTGISSIGFVAEASDSASISTTISSTSTFFDFNLTDDNNNDEWRWRFTPSGGTIYSAMRLVPVSNTASNLVVSGSATASNFADGTGSFNVNLGSGGSEGRGLVAGFSGGQYGNIGYNIRHTGTSDSYIAPSTDTATLLTFNSGFTFRYAGTGTAGRTLSLTTLATLNASGTFNSTNVTVNGNQSLHAGNYTSYTLPIGGGWYGVNIPGSRWGGYAVNGGEISFGRDTPNTSQMSILVDGCFIAGENNGFWSLPSNNDWNGRRGMFYDGSVLDFTTNSAVAAFTQVRANYGSGGNGSNGDADYGVIVRDTGTTSSQATIGAIHQNAGMANLNLGDVDGGTRRFWHISKRLSNSTDFSAGSRSLSYYWYNGTGFTLAFAFSTGGSFYAAADVVAYASSDITLKDNTAKIEAPIEKLKALNGYSFNWNDKQSTYEVGKKDLGVVAQEVEKVFPEIVKDRLNGTKGVMYDRLVPVLIEAIKEQQSQIDELNNTINALTK